MKEYEYGLWIFMLAAFLGFQLIRGVSPLLHTPLMSLTNAISAIAVVGAILITGERDAPPLSKVLGFTAVLASTINLVSGYLITDRMLKMFRSEQEGSKNDAAFASGTLPPCSCGLHPCAEVDEFPRNGASRSDCRRDGNAAGGYWYASAV